MAKTETTVKGYVYTVTSPNGGTVTDAEGKLNKTVDAGDQVTVTAPSDSLTCDDDDAVICKANFKCPLLALRMLGQGENALPPGYTRLEFLASDGVAAMALPFESKNKSFVCEHTLGMPKATSGLYVYGGTSVSDGYGIRYHANLQGLSFTGSDRIGNGTFLRGEKYKILWKVTRNEAGNFIFGLEYNGEVLKKITQLYNQYWENVYYVFGSTNYETRIGGATYELTISIEGKLTYHVVPAIDPTGEPCMFDRVSKQPFRNSGSGSFIAGVGTVAQLTTLLRRLPATGGALTLSLPAEANTPEVAEQLQACHDTKGWTLTVHEYRPAAAATYSLRRVREVVWCRREQSDLGSYVDSTGTRWQIDRCAAIFGALGQDPAAYCYTPFDSVEQAVEFWGLVPYESPDAIDEAMGDNGTLMQGGTSNTSPETNS